MLKSCMHLYQRGYWDGVFINILTKCIWEFSMIHFIKNIDKKTTYTPISKPIICFFSYKKNNHTTCLKIIENLKNFLYIKKFRYTTRYDKLHFFAILFYEIEEMMIDRFGLFASGPLLRPVEKK